MWLRYVDLSSLFSLSAAVCFSMKSANWTHAGDVSISATCVSIHRYILDFILCIKGKRQHCSQSNCCPISVAATLGLPDTLLTQVLVLSAYSKNLSVVDKCKIKINIILTQKMSLSLVIFQYSAFSTSTWKIWLALSYKFWKTHFCTQESECCL